jgi:hypothetical protein
LGPLFKTFSEKDHIGLQEFIPKLICRKEGRKTFYENCAKVFFVCWTPFHAQRLMFVIVTLQEGWTNSNSFAHHVLFLSSGSFPFIHSDETYCNFEGDGCQGFLYPYLPCFLECSQKHSSNKSLIWADIFYNCCYVQGIKISKDYKIFC